MEAQQRLTPEQEDAFRDARKSLMDRMAAAAQLSARVRDAELEVAEMRRQLVDEEEFILRTLDTLELKNATVAHPLGSTLIYKQGVTSVTCRVQFAENAQRYLDEKLGDMSPRITKAAVDIAALKEAVTMLYDQGIPLPEGVGSYSRTSIRYRHSQG